MGLVEDGVELFAHDRGELLVEFRGTSCRMLLDRNVTIDIGDVELRVGFDQTLRLTSPDGDTAWEAPVEVTVPARVASRILESLGMSGRKIRKPSSPSRSGSRGGRACHPDRHRGAPVFEPVGGTGTEAGQSHLVG